MVKVKFQWIGWSGKATTFFEHLRVIGDQRDNSFCKVHVPDPKTSLSPCPAALLIQFGTQEIRKRHARSFSCVPDFQILPFRPAALRGTSSFRKPRQGRNIYRKSSAKEIPSPVGATYR
jgi:hypothetical protein